MFRWSHAHTRRGRGGESAEVAMEKRRLESVNSLHNLAERTPSGVPAHNTDNIGASVAVCGCSGGKVQVNNNHQRSEAAVADVNGTS